jgi:methyl-accepting chemotaxis protein
MDFRCPYAPVTGVAAREGQGTGFRGFDYAVQWREETMNWFMNLKTRSKLLLGFGIVILCLLTVIIAATMAITDLNTSTQGIYTEEYANILDIQAINVNLNIMRIDTYAMFATTDNAVILQRDADIQTREQEVSTALDRLNANVRGPETIIALRAFQDQLTVYVNVREDTVIPLIKAGKTSEALVISNGVQEARFENISTTMNTMVSLENTRRQIKIQNNEQEMSTAIILFIVLGIISVFVAAVMILILTRTIARPLVAVSKAAQRGADGDLTVEIPADPRTDEVGMLLSSFRTMLVNLRRSNREVQEGVATLSSTATELMATSAESASTMQETATAIAETTATVEEVRQTVHMSNTRAKGVADNVQKVSLVAQGGVKSVEENIRAMNIIKEHVDKIAENIVQLSGQSQAIGEINGAINDIADQSNLLAVNAAIEAAKSGEEGKGFTVVAEEIRNLADQSKQATVKVQKILSDIQKSMNASVLAAEQGTKSVEAGILQANTAGQAIQSLAQSAEEASQSAMQTAASGQQQMVGMDQVTSAMESIKQASVQNLATVRQAEEAVRTLHEIGIKLKQNVDRYRV